AGATASDACAGDLTGGIVITNGVNTNAVGSYQVSYTVSDGYNVTTVYRTVNLFLPAALPILITGANPQTVECHTAYAEAGATASDACAGDLMGGIVITNCVHTNAVGSYQVSYTVSDGYNVTTVYRTVNVVDTTAPAILITGAN